MRTRNYRISVHLTAQEEAHLTQQVNRSRLRREPFLRALIMGKEIKAHPPELWADMVRQLSAIGNNINQIAHIANATHSVQQKDIDAIAAILGELWRKVKDI